ncbi:hypothetical protein AB3Y40_06865 [Yoonia sp. R2331]|uniref:hypothetical protein n=1 Tax=Yoonia sp. R2331 TaxID=3237238 RepID=UPI0034E5C4E4
MRLALILVLILTACTLAWWQGGTGKREADARADTLERINDADTSKGDPAADDAWLRDWLHRN